MTNKIDCVYIIIRGMEVERLSVLMKNVDRKEVRPLVRIQPEDVFTEAIENILN
ncbi:MAG: hypothetical protein KAH06_00085 [Desulfobacterales bacterium]|nr:hypothetical protein [Desulfobacterales bacterium]